MINTCMIPVMKSLQDYQAYRISPNDKHKLAIIFSSVNTNTSLTVCLEIFDVGGKTPLHQHHFAVEMFFILKGEGKASCDGKSIKISGGDSILMPPTSNHIIENIGSNRLYALCIMVPNEDFVELIKSGTPVDLDEEDMQVLNSSNFSKFLKKREGK